MAGRQQSNIQNIVASVEPSDALIDVEENIYPIYSLGKRVMKEPDQFPEAV